jgi:predicted dehydrogenase
MSKSSSSMDGRESRRDFLKVAAGAGALLASLDSLAEARIPKKKPESIDQPAPPIDPVRIGYVGVGGMGTNHVSNLVRIPGAEIRAVCDIVPEKVVRAQEIVVKSGQQKPEGYHRSETDFERLCERDDLDLIYTATPWKWHVPVCLAAMKNGKHAATEVPAATTIDDCWKLVESSEETGRYCIMMENCCYDRTELMILNMARQGLLGELLHAECGYLHDLRGVKFSDHGEGLWRIAHSIRRNADLYPTHGLGPVAWWMDINRGNRLDYLVSMSCNSRGLNQYAAEKFGPDSREARRKYALGDVVNTLIRTVDGRTILVTHDTDTPRPYSRKIMLQGTRGLVRKYPEEKIHIDGRSKGHDWESLDAYREEFEHPVWKEMASLSKGAGHGGMDFIEDYRLIQALRNGDLPDLDVYDAAAWSSVIGLSEWSIEHGSRPVKFPDFTRGAWKDRGPVNLA